ncbi:MAG: hypothetical protein ABI416_04390 [Ginsengibacter sp.]
MFVSKHHYAVELARKGNHVYFLNPPNYEHRDFSETVEIKPSNFHSNLFLIQDNILFPFNIKFHFIGLFHLLIRRHVKEILRKINKPVDIVWSFDMAQVYPLNYFVDSTIKIFHPVDYPFNKTAIGAARGAQFIFSTAKEILEKYEGYKVPKQFINHGIAGDFLTEEKRQKSGNTIRVGFSGNLLRNDIDRNTLLAIILDNQEIVFEFWGSYEFKDANLSGSNDEVSINFINELRRSKNVILHGPVSTGMLAKSLQCMDAFLICYDLTVKNANGPNYHKVIEFISTGKVTISNNITTYKDEPELIQMITERENNRSLPALFKKVTADLSFYNSVSLQEKRIAFAGDNTYNKQIGRIETILSLQRKG